MIVELLKKIVDLNHHQIRCISCEVFLFGSDQIYIVRRGATNLETLGLFGISGSCCLKSTMKPKYHTELWYDGDARILDLGLAEKL